MTRKFKGLPLPGEERESHGEAWIALGFILAAIVFAAAWGWS